APPTRWRTRDCATRERARLPRLERSSRAPEACWILSVGRPKKSAVELANEKRQRGVHAAASLPLPRRYIADAVTASTPLLRGLLGGFGRRLLCRLFGGTFLGGLLGRFLRRLGGFLGGNLLSRRLLHRSFFSSRFRGHFLGDRCTDDDDGRQSRGRSGAAAR